MKRNEKEKYMVTVAIAGLGARGGYIYSAFQKNRPDLMKTVAIADLKEELVEKYGRELGVKEENRFSSAEKRGIIFCWKSLFHRGRTSA